MKDKLILTLTRTGMGWSVPVVRIFSGEFTKEQFLQLWKNQGIPVVSITIFLLLWAYGASKVNTSLGKMPGPVEVYAAAQNLWRQHQEERIKAVQFYQRQEERNRKLLAGNPAAVVKVREYTGKPTYIDQIRTSLLTVFAGFTIATMVAVPLGIVCGLSRTFMSALNPLIQVFKPVSPLAWLPIVTMVVSALYVSGDGWLAKSFIISAITVALCSLWPGLINTALGVGSIDKDYINVARVLKLGPLEKTFKIVLPASLPYIFTGLRISLGVGWMVLIAAEMLAQNPGLGKFVWDEFQNGSSQSLARIMVAVFTVGIVGFMLDRVMVALQRLVSFDKNLQTA